METKFKNVITVEGHGHSNRPPYLPEEGGALNAGWRTVDALVHISNILGTQGLQYNRDWYWESNGSSTIRLADDHYSSYESSYILSFKNSKDAEMAKFWLQLIVGDKT